MTDLSIPYQCAPEVLFQEVNGEIVLLDLQGETYFGLNETGARVWQLLQDGKVGDELLDMMLDEFEVDRPQLEADVTELISQLSEAGLIVRKDI